LRIGWFAAGQSIRAPRLGEDAAADACRDGATVAGFDAASDGVDDPVEDAAGDADTAGPAALGSGCCSAV
jgi:hypothetical protein